MVRLGWLPLEYRLALNAIMWCLRILNRSAGPTLKSFYDTISCRPDLLDSTAIVQPAIDFVNYLNIYSTVNLLEIPLRLVKAKIIAAMFNELTDFWAQSDSCSHLHLIHSDWQPRNFSSRSLSRVTTSCYHTFACGHGYLRSWSHHIGLIPSPNCRHGCGIPETAAHILLSCPFYNNERNSVCKLCESLGLNVSLQTFLTDCRLQTRVEKLLHLFLKSEQQNCLS